MPPDDRQLTLALLETLLAQHGAAELVTTKAVRAHEGATPSGRKPLPDHLPRVDVELIPFEVQQSGLEHFRRIGEEVSEVLERRRASSVVVRVIRPKFVAKDTPRQGPVQVLIGDPADLPILRGRAGPGMLADTVVRRWQDHQPLHRLERIYARDGLPLARSTICGWHAELADLARPLVEAMHAEALRQPYLCADATVLVQAPETCRHGHFWVVVRENSSRLEIRVADGAETGPRDCGAHLRPGFSGARSPGRADERPAGAPIGVTVNLRGDGRRATLQAGSRDGRRRGRAGR